ncbi:MAG: HDOD domain-containing protein [Proteobacteria bacterium]|nr:HDOD domain-containing protein [Pseudomonadota bacterium]
MNQQKPIPIEQQIESLPPLPITVANVLAVTNNPESSANDLVKAILPDQTMCIAVLKIANSVLYGQPKKVSSLETAVIQLGFNEVQNIVLAKAAVQAFQPIFKTHEEDLYAFWDHAFTCGLAARIVGEHINLPSGQFFVAGLLHDVGKLAMLLAFGKKYDTGKWLKGIYTEESLKEEQQTFAITHDVVGGKLLQRWQFPDNLITALRYHHTPGNAEQLQGYPLVIQLADFLSHMYVLPEKPDEQTLKAALATYLPHFQKQWQEMHLPWEDITLEEWFAWLKVDRENGSAILDILAM